MKVKFYSKQGKWSYRWFDSNNSMNPIWLFYGEYEHQGTILYRRTVTTKEMGELIYTGEDNHQYTDKDIVELNEKIFTIEKVYKNPEGFTCILDDYSLIEDDEESKEKAYKVYLENTAEINSTELDKTATIIPRESDAKSWWKLW